MKKKLDNLSVLALAVTGLFALICIIGFITVLIQFGSTIETKDGPRLFLDIIKENGQYFEAIQLFIMMPLATLVSASVFADCFLRKEVSHIGVLLGGGILVLVYSLINCIGGFIYAGVGSIFFYGASVIAAGAMIFFFIKKMLDGDVTLGWKIAAGATLGLIFFSVCVAYPFLEAYSHIGDALFWTNGIFGLAIIAFTGVLLMISASSDYDPNPIELDEFGNPIDNDK